VSANPAALAFPVQAARDARERKRAAIKGAMKLLEEARWFVSSSGILLSAAGMTADHPAASELATAVGALNEAIERVAALEVAADKATK